MRTSVWLASSLEIRVQGIRIHFSRVALTIIHKCVQTRERTVYLQRLPPRPRTHYIRRDLSRVYFPISLSLYFFLFLMASSTLFNAGFLFPHRGKRMARFVLASHSWVLYEKASTKRVQLWNAEIKHVLRVTSVLFNIRHNIVIYPRNLWIGQNAIYLLISWNDDS